MTRKPPTRKGPKQVWKDEFYFEIYEMVKQGATYEEIGNALGVKPGTINTKWLVEKPLLRHAVDRAMAVRKEAKNGGDEFRTYLEERLPPKVKALYEEIEYWCDHAEGPEKIRALIAPHGNKMHQSLWLHAMIDTNFDTSEACRKVNVTKRLLDKWTEEDPDFPSLVDEVQWHKKNFFEKALIDMGTLRDSKAVVFANQTLNRDRGYGKSLDVKMSGTVTHAHVVIPVEKLNLPLEVLMQIEQAMQGLPEQTAPRTPLPVKALAIGSEKAGDEGAEDGDND